jgi:uncharacterized integral membrane protein
MATLWISKHFTSAICFFAILSNGAYCQESNPDVVAREAKALVEDTNKNLDLTKSLFSSPVITEEKFITDLREQRAVASRLFAKIRSVINKSDIAVQQIKLEVSKLNQQLTSIAEDISFSDDDKSQFNSSVAVALEYFGQALASANTRIAEGLAQQKDVSAKIEDIRKNGIEVDNERTKWNEATLVLSGRRPSTTEMRKSAIDTINSVNQSLRPLFEKDRAANNDVNSAKKDVANYQKILGVYKNISSQNLNMGTLVGLTALLQNGENDLEASINKIDEKFVSKINDNRTKDFYTATTTAVFGLAVIVVIIFFFRLANNDSVRLALFQNDSGLQFVTLFSIVIAIILFGVLRILEGRELAALLGGLSGYILGRGSISKQGPSRDGSTPANAPTGAVVAQ